MNNKDKERLKHAIRDRIDELTLILQPVDEDSASDDQSAKLDRLITSGVSSAVSSATLRNLRLLKENLSWIDSEDGGYCEACGCEIAVARLMAMPTTRLCVDCADKQEQLQ